MCAVSCLCRSHQCSAVDSLNPLCIACRCDCCSEVSNAFTVRIRALNGARDRRLTDDACARCGCLECGNSLPIGCLEVGSGVRFKVPIVHTNRQPDHCRAVAGQTRRPRCERRGAVVIESPHAPCLGHHTESVDSAQDLSNGFGRRVGGIQAGDDAVPVEQDPIAGCDRADQVVVVPNVRDRDAVDVRAAHGAEQALPAVDDLHFFGCAGAPQVDRERLLIRCRECAGGHALTVDQCVKLCAVGERGPDIRGALDVDGACVRRETHTGEVRLARRRDVVIAVVPEISSDESVLHRLPGIPRIECKVVVVSNRRAIQAAVDRKMLHRAWGEQRRRRACHHIQRAVPECARVVSIGWACARRFQNTIDIEIYLVRSLAHVEVKHDVVPRLRRELDILRIRETDVTAEQRQLIRRQTACVVLGEQKVAGRIGPCSELDSYTVRAVVCIGPQQVLNRDVIVGGEVDGRHARRIGTGPVEVGRVADLPCYSA